MIALETPRLLLREFQPGDYPDLFKLNADHLVTRYTGDGPFESLKAVEDFFAGYAERQYKPFRMGRLTVLEKATGSFVGWCGLKRLEEGYVDLGYRFLRAFWGKGYATEASKACLRYGFEVLGLEEIIANAMIENTPSIRVMQKLGMEQIGTPSCGNQPGVRYRLTRDQYLKLVQNA